MSIPQDKIEEIKETVSIVDMVSSHVSLRRAGANYVGLCPFHGEKTPSFTVSEAKKIFYCFGCQTGGNVFTFLMKLKGLSFIEAVKEVAERYGIKLPKDFRGATEDKGLKERLYQVMERACRFFQKALGGAEGRGGLEYLFKRGLKPKTIELFRLGYAPDKRDALNSALMNEGVTLEEAVSCGLCIASEGERPRDRFRARVIFPITDVKARVVGFGGRILSGEGLAKYLNSPDGPIFKKSNLLYGLPLSGSAMQKEGAAIVVEGYMDLISLYQAGFSNVVAPLGTALTPGHARLISRYTKKAVLVFDGDEAGIKAALRALEPLLKEGLEPYVALLPLGLDPDEFIKGKGQDSFRGLLGKAEPLPVFYVRKTAQTAGSAVLDRAEAIKTAAKVIGFVPDKVAKEIYLKDLADALKVPQEAVRKGLTEGPAGKPGRLKHDVSPKGAEEVLVAILLAYPALIPGFREEGVLGLFQDKTLKEVATILVHREEDGLETSVASVLSEISELNIHAKVVGLAMFGERLTAEEAGLFFKDKVRALGKGSFIEKMDEEVEGIKKRIAQAEADGDWECQKGLLVKLKGMQKKSEDN